MFSVHEWSGYGDRGLSVLSGARGDVKYMAIKLTIIKNKISMWRKW